MTLKKGINELITLLELFPYQSNQLVNLVSGVVNFSIYARSDWFCLFQMIWITRSYFRKENKFLSWICFKTKQDGKFCFPSYFKQNKKEILFSFLPRKINKIETLLLNKTIIKRPWFENSFLTRYENLN